MNAKILACLLIGVISGFGGRAAAQNEASGPSAFPRQASQPNLREFHSGVELARLTKKLKLNEQQQNQIKSILEDRDAQMRSLREKNIGARHVTANEAASVWEESNAKIEVLLDKRQRRLFKRNQQAIERRQRDRPAEGQFMEDSAQPPDDAGPPDTGPPPDLDGPSFDGPPDDGPPE